MPGYRKLIPKQFVTSGQDFARNGNLEYRKNHKLSWAKSDPPEEISTDSPKLDPGALISGPNVSTNQDFGQQTQKANNF